LWNCQIATEASTGLAQEGDSDTILGQLNNEALNTERHELPFIQHRQSESIHLSDCRTENTNKH
jgi:hypothetical protein